MGLLKLVSEVNVFKSIGQRAVGVFVLGVILHAMPASADILDEILDLTTAARDRATQARDRATEARDRATEARNSANELRDNARIGLAALTGQIRTLISEAVEDVQQMVEDELEGREAFVADGGCSLAVCEPFRENLVALLRNIEAIINTILAIVELEELHFDFEREIAIIKVLPGRALFPLHRMLAVEINLFDSNRRGAGAVEWLASVYDKLLVLKEAFEEKCLPGDPQTPLESEVLKCTCVLKHYERIGQAQSAVQSAGLALKIIAKIVKAKAATSAEGINPGIHGYIHLTLKDNKRKKVGETLDGVSDLLSKIAESADDLARDCVVYSAQFTMLQNQQEIKDAIKELSVKSVRDPDLDADGDVDLMDYSMFQRTFGSR